MVIAAAVLRVLAVAVAVFRMFAVGVLVAVAVSVSVSMFLMAVLVVASWNLSNWAFAMTVPTSKGSYNEDSKHN